MAGWRLLFYYGQFCGQYTARSLASPGVNQANANSQLLLGVNDVSAAAAMHLAGVQWKGASTSSAFLLWIRSHVLMGHPVIIGACMLGRVQIHSLPIIPSMEPTSLNSILNIAGCSIHLLLRLERMLSQKYVKSPTLVSMFPALPLQYLFISQLYIHCIWNFKEFHP